MGATDLWLWRSDEGRSGEYLRRAILLPFGALLLMHAVLVVAGLTLDRGEVSWPDLLPVAIGALDLAVAVGTFLGRLPATAVAALCASAATTAAIPDVTESRMHLPASLATSCALVAIGISFRRRPAIMIGSGVNLASTASGLWLLSAGQVYVLDQAVVNLGMLVGGTALMASLVAATRETDALARRADEVEGAVGWSAAPTSWPGR